METCALPGRIQMHHGGDIHSRDNGRIACKAYSQHTAHGTTTTTTLTRPKKYFTKKKGGGAASHSDNLEPVPSGGRKGRWCAEYIRQGPVVASGTNSPGFGGTGIGEGCAFLGGPPHNPAAVGWWSSASGLWRVSKSPSGTTQRCRSTHHCLRRFRVRGGDAKSQ